MISALGMGLVASGRGLCYIDRVHIESTCNIQSYEIT